MTRIGLVGAGFIARAHAAAYDTVDDAAVTAVAAPSSADAFADAHAPDATTHPDVDSLLAGTDVDAVDVCTPTPTHREVVETVAAHDLPVLCEKPLARTLDDARALAELDDLMVGHVVRFAPAYRRAREHLGPDVGVVRTRRVGPMPDWSDWYADHDRSGGVLLDLAIHDLDFLRWTVGPVERVFARRARWGEGHEHAVATLRFESGAVAHVEGSWGQPASRAFTTSIEVASAGLLLEHDAEDPTGFRHYATDGAIRETSVGRSAMARQLSAFVDWVDAGASGDPPVTGEDALAAVRLGVAAGRSAERGEPVAPAEVGP